MLDPKTVNTPAICSTGLQGKAALVTGGGVRVGAAIVKALHQAGMNLVLHYNRSAEAAQRLADQLNQSRANSVVCLQADLLETAKLPGLIEQSIQCFDRLDALINNASTYYPTPIGQGNEVDWQDLVGSNAKAPFFLSQAAVPELRKNRGSIVNLVDIHAERPHAEHTIYCMAKAANAMLVKSLARELAPEIRVNGVAPGAVIWPENHQTDSERVEIRKRIPLDRPGSPEDIAQTVLFLLAGPSYLTGQIIAVDGGRTVQQ